MIISKSHNKTLVSAGNNIGKFMPFLRDCIISFSFLVDINETLTGKEFSERIAEYYSIDNPKVRLAVDVISGELSLSQYYPMHLYR